MMPDYLLSILEAKAIAAAPTVPASVMPPVPNQAAAPMTRAERWHEAAKGALC